MPKNAVNTGFLRGFKSIDIRAALMVALHIVLRNLTLVGLRLFREIVHGVGFLQKSVALVLFVGKYPLDRGGVPFRLVGGTEVAVRFKLPADAIGRHALKEQAVDFLYCFRLCRVYDHPAVKCPDVLFLEIALDAVLYEFSYRCQAVHGVPCEPADALGHNQVCLSRRFDTIKR